MIAMLESMTHSPTPKYLSIQFLTSGEEVRVSVLKLGLSAGTAY
jgi:hypothetical protein